MSKTRLEVGQVVHTVHFDTTNENFKELFAMPYMYRMDNVTGINILELTVTEHHKVRGDYDDETVEPKYDGFVLKDKQGRIWHNQYPLASYGQLSDESDHEYNLAISQMNYDKFETYDDLMKVMNITYFESRNLNSTIRAISRGIIQLGEDIGIARIIDAGQYLKIVKLIEVYQKTLALFETQNPGKTIQIEPHKEYPETIQYGRIVDKADATHSYFDINNWIALNYLDQLKEAYLTKLNAGDCYEQSVISLMHPNKLKICFNNDQLVLVYCHYVWTDNDELRDIADNTTVHTAETIDAFIEEIQTAVSGTSSNQVIHV